MKRLLVFLLLILPSLVLAQFSPIEQQPEKDKSKFRLSDRLFVGGGFGFSFGTITSIDLSPLVGLQLTERLRMGVGGTYMYYEDTRYSYSTNIYGGRVFYQYKIYQGLFAHAEGEVLSGDFGIQGERRNVSSLFVGGGYQQMLGSGFYANVLLLINLTEDVYSPYTNPVYRVGIGYSPFYK
tara:strand:+ start:2648 stop:3190 length:543 start_codon:yes stop_codon:yes gene_type:complete